VPVEAGIAGAPALERFATVTYPVMRAFAGKFPLTTQADSWFRPTCRGGYVLVLFQIRIARRHWPLSFLRASLAVASVADLPNLRFLHIICQGRNTYDAAKYG
jgi:hypothetical protein